jgi:hypothetical protein
MDRDTLLQAGLEQLRYCDQKTLECVRNGASVDAVRFARLSRYVMQKIVIPLQYPWN